MIEHAPNGGATEQSGQPRLFEMPLPRSLEGNDPRLPRLKEKLRADNRTMTLLGEVIGKKNGNHAVINGAEVEPLFDLDV